MESYSNTVSEPNNPLSSTLNKIQDIDCYGDSTGSVQLVVSGGVPNYTYLWDNGETSIVATQLTAGLHMVSITDDWNCTICLLYTSPSPRDRQKSRMPSSA